MYNLFIDRSTKSSGIAFVAKTSGDTAIIHNKLVGYLVQLSSRNTRPDSLCHFGIGLSQQDVALSHEFYFFIRLKENHLKRLPK